VIEILSHSIYLVGMQQLSDLKRGHIYLIDQQYTFDLTINLALHTGIRLLVCGNHLPFYDIAYALAARVGQRYEAILREQITFSRAETCIQLVDFLSEMVEDPTPLLITDLLARFNDEDQRQVDALFFACQIEMERLCKASLFFVSATPRPPLERLGFALQRITHALAYGSA
jgi:hypothetical protein